MAVIGTYIDDKYEILKEIGHGGMSVVYLAMDKRLNKQWAIKELQKKARDANNEIVIQSAIAEANMIKKLDHPALPRIVDIIDEQDVIYVVMDYIEGETLDYVVNQYGAQSQEQVIDWAKQLCQVLHYLHTRTPPIIYRDMKPANVMLKPDGNLKVIDFGIAREYKSSNLQDTICLGTRGYAAPEQFGGQGQTDARTDIYCLGATLYHLVTGHNPAEPPYEIYPIRHWNSQLSGGLENIIEKCTQLNPNDRYQSCAELLYALEHYEEEDDAFKQAQKKKLNIFRLTSLMTIIFMVLGIGSLFIKNNINMNDYRNNLELAEKSTDTVEKRKYCIQSISLLPQNPEAYEKLIEVYKDNNAFDVEESVEFKEQVSEYLNQLQNSNSYPNVAYEVGKLYWYYYDYGDNDNQNIPITKMINSISWFEDAIQYGNQEDDFYHTAQIYKDIGTFYKELQIKVNEGESVNGMYKSYFKNLQSMLERISKYNEAEIVELETYKLIIVSIENYAREFADDDVKQEEMTSLFNQAISKVEQIKPTSSKTSDMKKYIEERKSSIQQFIQNAYIEKVVEEE